MLHNAEPICNQKNIRNDLRNNLQDNLVSRTIYAESSCSKSQTPVCVLFTIQTH